MKDATPLAIYSKFTLRPTWTTFNSYQETSSCVCNNICAWFKQTLCRKQTIYITPWYPQPSKISMDLHILKVLHAPKKTEILAHARKLAPMQYKCYFGPDLGGLISFRPVTIYVLLTDYWIKLLQVRRLLALLGIISQVLVKLAVWRVQWGNTAVEWPRPPPQAPVLLAAARMGCTPHQPTVMVDNCFTYIRSSKYVLYFDDNSKSLTCLMS